ncbi:MerR family transcriptional regulator [Rarobacter incanus]|nr:MerR family transcriptional regulator [Rarobacter incanus]
MRISDVLAALQAEFPAVTHSKLRFLEEQGLVEPTRTASGYRQYSPADVQRLRFVLGEQRDRYLPLKVIKEKLADLDAGLDASTQPLIPTVISRDGVTAAKSLSMSVRAVAQRTSVDESIVNDFVLQGLIDTVGNGELAPWADEIVRLGAALQEQGLDVRHLRALHTAAQRNADLVEQVVRSIGRPGSPATQAHRASVAAEIGENISQLFTASLRQALAEIR